MANKLMRFRDVFEDGAQERKAQYRQPSAVSRAPLEVVGFV